MTPDDQGNYIVRICGDPTADTGAGTRYETADGQVFRDAEPFEHSTHIVSDNHIEPKW